ncbi:hypothetical protein K668_01640 [Mycoplasmopsis bovis CQ-W70]|uniref:Uncharacterized protein n=1 Tax=Mycoplasmopsis bovis CQ-W70 TaxID=1316930 RepID=A0A059Y3I5_MYCBV|nr:hypothetical protein [Mycoplasmopsis bovis]AEI90040.1 hypothetical protein MMB_0326 [Mycoplasmopsis bovis Hubei-1]AFM51714.1 Hypothetical protein Mbov_0348 [Mycoplasmopsis bovis HB0801]AIA33910.1 hypothetical protein K668_01640 [Mycoplasmopsis bovis CQ-W70]WEI90657.1 hypothetical protein PY997_01800 [Mycoplasmopsis bovis]
MKVDFKKSACLIVGSSATPIKVKFNCGALEFLNKKSSTLGSRKLSYELY